MDYRPLMLTQNSTRCSWFYDPVTNEKKCIIDKIKTKQKSLKSYADQLAVAQSRPVALGPFLVHVSELREQSGPMQGDPAWPG